jgi:hypothetical protein
MGVAAANPAAHTAVSWGTLGHPWLLSNGLAQPFVVVVGWGRLVDQQGAVAANEHKSNSDQQQPDEQAGRAVPHRRTGHQMQQQRRHEGRDEIDPEGRRRGPQVPHGTQPARWEGATATNAVKPRTTLRGLAGELGRRSGCLSSCGNSSSRRSTPASCSDRSSVTSV